MLKRTHKETIPELRDPGEAEPEPCSPGSIEQQLDMCEDGDLKGDEIDHRTAEGSVPLEYSDDEEPLDLRKEINSFELTMAERDREGDEMSGDDHSAGLQGGEPEIENQPHIDSGTPGSLTREQEMNEKELEEPHEVRRVRRKER